MPYSGPAEWHRDVERANQRAYIPPAFDDDLTPEQAAAMQHRMAEWLRSQPTRHQARRDALWNAIGEAVDRWEDGEQGMRGAQRDALLDTIIDYFDPVSQAHAAPTSRAYTGADAWVA